MGACPYTPLFRQNSAASGAAAAGGGCGGGPEKHGRRTLLAGGRAPCLRCCAAQWHGIWTNTGLFYWCLLTLQQQCLRSSLNGMCAQSQPLQRSLPYALLIPHTCPAHLSLLLYQTSASLLLLYLQTWRVASFSHTPPPPSETCGMIPSFRTHWVVLRPAFSSLGTWRALRHVALPARHTDMPASHIAVLTYGILFCVRVQVLPCGSSILNVGTLPIGWTCFRSLPTPAPPAPCCPTSPYPSTPLHLPPHYHPPPPHPFPPHTTYTYLPTCQMTQVSQQYVCFCRTDNSPTTPPPPSLPSPNKTHAHTAHLHTHIAARACILHIVHCTIARTACTAARTHATHMTFAAHAFLHEHRTVVLRFCCLQHAHPHPNSYLPLI